MSDHKDKKPMTASDYIKTQPHLQRKNIINQNTFSALAEFPPLTYAKAVNTDKGQTSGPTQTPTPKSDYYTKPQKNHLMTTQFVKPTTLKELTSFTSRLFYSDSLYPTDNPTKSRTFYEYILVDSKSVEITHYPDKTDPNIISYSTCKILKIFSIFDLGFLTHHTTKPFSTPGFHIPGYTYIDYKNAIFNTFYLRPYTHSWFISFDTNCNKQLPGWFCEWWYWFGPMDQIYPSEILKTSYPFYLKNISQNPIQLFNKIAFHIDMGIPWICSWHFTITSILQDMPFSLVREYRVKWWDKYNLDRCSLTNIQKFFQIIKQTKSDVASISRSIPLITPSQLQTPPSSSTQKSTNNQPITIPDSPSHSTDSTKSTKKDKLKQILATLVRQLDSSDEDEPMSEEATYGGPLAQDPFQD